MTKLMLPSIHSCSIAIIGLGYVGLPLALEFGKPQTCLRTKKPNNRSVIGFDINRKRLVELSSGIDRTKETTTSQFKEATNLVLSDDPKSLINSDVFIVTVPTPIDIAKRPDLSSLKKASETVGIALRERFKRKPNECPIVIYESTVYPGATEEVCVPILEKHSGLKFNQHFFCGYSPERINPGDMSRTLTSITKVTSGSTEESAKWIDKLYGSIISAGTHLSSSIKVAEAAKVIENTQRDLNIALVNELAMIFNKLGIDTLDVLEAAGSKWNFLPFKPGLVGGHCIGVDPYYLTHKAEQVGYHPEVVLAGRRINDQMGEWIGHQIVLALAKHKLEIVGSRILILGLTFKENCPDLRNTKVVDLISLLKKFGVDVDVVDPHAHIDEAMDEYGLQVSPTASNDVKYTAVVVAVAHKQFADFVPDKWLSFLVPDGLLFDLKGIIPKELKAFRL
jgi:UDP-N-acetyl-D-galactosamine dehydrogenase